MTVYWEDDFERWFREKMRRARMPFSSGWFFQDLDEMFSDIEELFKKELREFTSNIPKSYVRERKLQDGRKIHEWGPFVYGYSLTIGPKGKPVVREFGNLQPGTRGPLIKEEREPLVDVVDTNGEIKVVVELPGVNKKDIKLTALDDKLTISVAKSDRKYYKEVNIWTSKEDSKQKQLLSTEKKLYGD